MGDNESDHESDEEYVYLGLRHMAERRRDRPAKERDQIKVAEDIWAAKVEKQRAKVEANHAALAHMFGSMPDLRGIQVVHWCCSLKEYSIKDHCEQVV
jgi:hypothetical protein